MVLDSAIFRCVASGTLLNVSESHLLFCKAGHGASQVAPCKEPACRCRRCRFHPWVRTIPWRRKPQPTTVLLTGKSHGQRSLAGYSPWVHNRVGQD